MPLSQSNSSRVCTKPYEREPCHDRESVVVVSLVMIDAVADVDKVAHQDTVKANTDKQGVMDHQGTVKANTGQAGRGSHGKGMGEEQAEESEQHTSKSLNLTNPPSVILFNAGKALAVTKPWALQE